jgi:hypothetical protein
MPFRGGLEEGLGGCVLPVLCVCVSLGGSGSVRVRDYNMSVCVVINDGVTI